MKRILKVTVDRPTNATDSVSLVREWLYNRRSELTAATVGTNLYGYSYDTIGNRLWSAANVATNEYAANALNQYTSVGGSAPDAPQTAFIYDADGNMTRDGRFLYSYDAENRLRSVTARSATNGSLRVLNAYDHRNRRIRKTLQQLHLSVAQPPALPVEIREWQTLETHTFVWDGNNIVLEKVDFADGATRTFEYFWGMDKSGTEQGAGGVEGLLAVSMDGVFYIPCYDHNGNIVLYVSETGGIAAQYTYDPYGNNIESSGPLADVFSFGFSTQYHDRETGMVGYKRRFYRPDLGRWLNRDPIEEEGGENLYVFCGNNSITRYDIDGFAYFAYRPLEAPLIGRGIGIHGWNRLNEHDNKVMAHEQLVFEDGGAIINIGYGSDGMILNESMTGYVPKEKSGYYNDCIMHKAVANVKPKPYSMLSWGSSIAILNRYTPIQYNCQDYADDLRLEYDRLMKDPCVRKKCGLN